MSPAHSRRQSRAGVLVVVVAVLVGLAVATRSPGVAAPGGPPVTPGSFVNAASSESSSWYCLGQSTSSGPVQGALVLTNTTARAVTGTITSTSDSGAQVQTAVAVPPDSQLVPQLSDPSGGTWVSEVVVLSSGGVAVTQAVHGATGWSESPCLSRTAQDWYFPSGLSTGTDTLYVAISNPTSTPDVADLAFVTPGGILHPINFQGLVLQPGQVTVADVSSYVQGQPSIATFVSARTGRIVADEMEAFSGSSTGLSVVAGTPGVQPHWTIPQSDEVAGASSEIDVFNPGNSTERVTVNIRLASGPVAPLVQSVLPLTTWVLSTSGQTRLPKSDAYATDITATGGNGVVVGRVVVAPSSAALPQAGLANAVDGLATSWPSHTWLVPSPGSTRTPAFAGALPAHLALANPTDAPVHYVVSVVTPQHTRRITAGTLAPHAGVSIDGNTLFGAGLYPLVVKADAALSVSEDVGPTGAYGVVTMPGIALDTAG